GGGGAAVKPPVENDKEDEDNKEDTENKENNDDNSQVVVPPSTEVTVPSNIVKELDGHWGEDEISSLYKAGIVTGDAEGLRLKDSISRAEFVTLVVRTLGLETVDYNNTFLDVDSADWHAPYIATAYSMGLVGGSDGMFRPDDTITREEMCKIIACATDAEFELKQSDFKDIDSISPWALEYVNKVYSLGIVNGMDDGTFAPKNNALREQAFIILARLKNVIK
ncbi:MAG: S-layer homology domain-containing protein, partial [Clostridia bacterium]|nr:S-layer homology domain-containing protein [Clostridia bacterium]